MSFKNFIHQLNKNGRQRLPFLFVIDFEIQRPFVMELHEVDNAVIRYSMDDGFLKRGNYEPHPSPITHQSSSLPYGGKVGAASVPDGVKSILSKSPLPFQTYQKAFDIVKGNLNYGNSFLTNLTAETPIELGISMEEVFARAKAKYKLYIKDNFLCYSPETFVQITPEGKISSFPMKGTIDAKLPDAEKLILSDLKEKYEHTTIVDLIRNDLSRVCEKVWVERFRYLDKITKDDGRELLQVSSEVCGQLPADWQDHIGDIFGKLLPAGSISGAPKGKTLSIIQEAEKLTYINGKRGFYTGIFGIFDGERLNSGVMIRFIEKRNGQYFFKSGGGITTRSDAKKEYQEMVDKIYLPLG
jgi:para-aminobenzoate synthetase component 1